jgi:hypothetical protein
LHPALGQYYSDLSYKTKDEALLAARKVVIWLAEALERRSR